MELTKEFLHQTFEYKDGNLYWKNVTSKNYRLNGMKVGCESKRSTYIQVGINKKKYYVHRIIFMMFHGYMPESVDHKDGDPRNNKIENLREATLCQNQYNKKLSKNNTSGVKGVYWNKAKSKWMARCRSDNKENYLGMFNSIDEAAKKITDFRLKLHGEYAKNV